MERLRYLPYNIVFNQNRPLARASRCDDRNHTPDYPETDLKNQNRVRLGKALGLGGQFDYIYDYGDNWAHRVRVLEVMPFDGPLDSP